MLNPLTSSRYLQPPIAASSVCLIPAGTDAQAPSNPEIAQNAIDVAVRRMVVPTYRAPDRRATPEPSATVGPEPAPASRRVLFLAHVAEAQRGPLSRSPGLEDTLAAVLSIAADRRPEVRLRPVDFLPSLGRRMPAELVGAEELGDLGQRRSGSATPSASTRSCCSERFFAGRTFTGLADARERAKELPPGDHARDLGGSRMTSVLINGIAELRATRAA